MLCEQGQKVILAQPRGDAYVTYQEARPDGTYEACMAGPERILSSMIMRIRIVSYRVSPL